MKLIKVVPQGHCMVIERFGKPVRVAKAGLRFLWPVLDKIRDVSTLWGDESNKDGIFIELTEQIEDTKPRECFTSDNVKVKVDCVYRWRITDPIQAIYEVDHLHRSIRETVLNEIRSLIGASELNAILSSRAQLSEQVAMAISDVVRRWGVNLVGAEIQELKVDDKTQEAMRMQLEAARKSEALKLEAEGAAAARICEAESEKQATLLKAEAEQQAIVLKAQGEREAAFLIADADQNYVRKLAEVLGESEAAKILLAQKTLQAYTALSDGSANKIFMPPPSAKQMIMLDGDMGDNP